MAVLNVTIPDFLQFSASLRFAILSLSLLLSPSRLLPSNDFILYPVGLENLCPWPFHYSSYTRSDILRVRFVCLSFSILSFSPPHLFSPTLFIFFSPLCPLSGPPSIAGRLRNIVMWGTIRCSRKDAPPWRRGCAERRKRLKKGAIRFAREGEKHVVRSNEYIRVFHKWN